MCMGFTMATAAPPTAPAQPAAPTPTRSGILRSLGIVGYDALEPVVLASIATETPLLLIGPHGTAKSLLLCRLAQALRLTWRHYNASLVNYDDLIGYPLPDASGKLAFVQTPASIWDAEVVFVDELSRARPDMLNRLFPIIHEKVVQGMPLPRLRHRWAAMNPPSGGDAADDAAPASSGTDYLGSEPLDPALADRFGFVVGVPVWGSLSPQDQDAVITSNDFPVDHAAGHLLRRSIREIQRELPLLGSYASAMVAEAVRELMRHAAELQLGWSGRRAAMIHRNILAVHAARLVQRADADLVESSWLAVRSSIPQRAQGLDFHSVRLKVAHDSVWKTVRLDLADPRRALASEPDPVRRAVRAAVLTELELQERSAYVADALAHLPPGGRQALGHWLVERGHAASLMASVAEQCAQLFAQVAGCPSVKGGVRSGSLEHQAWDEILTALESRGGTEDFPLLSNLLPALHTADQITAPGQTQAAIESWIAVREIVGLGAELPPAAPRSGPVRNRKGRSS